MRFSPGQNLGPYEIVAPLGSGGMVEVWKARATRLNRIVALQFARAAFTGRALREAQAIAALNHPNIATLYDVGPEYLVMEYVEGAPLRPPEDTRKLLDLAVQIADGLAATPLALSTAT
jgi:serine/threonine protein kinase